MSLPQGVDERRQAFVELLEVDGELALTAVAHRQDQHGQVIQHRHQLVPVQPAAHPLAQGFALRLVVRVRLRLTDPKERLHAGLPAFVELEEKCR